MNDPDVPQDGQTRLTLDAERFDAFVRLIETSPTPGPKLKALLRRIPAWEKRTQT